MEEGIAKVLSGFLCIFTWAIALILCYGLIYYEKNLNDRYRTLINELYTLILFYIMTILGTFNLLMVVRLFMDSALNSFCYGLNVLSSFSATSMCLAMNEATFVQYLYVCYYKTCWCFE